MVAKISKGASLFGALSYNIDKVKNQKAHVIGSNKCIQNMTDDTNLDLALAIRSFEPYLHLNDRIKKPIVHISLNPDPKDNLTDEEYNNLALDYLEKLGFKDQPFIIYKHEDIDRKHIHIVTVRVDEEGQKISDSLDHPRSMQACRELEQKYNLAPAISRKNEFSESYIKKIDYERGDIKSQISNTIRSICDAYNFHSFGEYNALLSCYNINAKLVKGEIYGEKYNGIVYSATDDNGKIVSTPFKSSLFGKRFGFNGLEKIMKRSNERLKQSDYKAIIKPFIYNAVKNATSKADLIGRLKDSGIDTIFRESKEGRIYGVTFIDHKNKMVINGSRLGKELSANIFNHLFNQAKQSKDTIVAEVDNNIQPSLELPTNQNTKSVFEQMFGGLFNFNSHGEDQLEKDFAYAMKKKQKKKKRKGKSL